MEDYKHSAKVGREIILTYLKKRMKQKKVTQKQLAIILDISVTSLWSYFKMKRQMPLGVYLEICGVLKLRPYLIPAENDDTEMHRVFFN